jgi:cbb3-type cytochrome oxidase maturation protein
MEILVLMLPMMLIIGGLMLFGLIWAIRSGQFDDLEDEKFRMFDADELSGMAENLAARRRP